MTERTCNECRYWSEMIARAGGGTTNPLGLTEAMCLAPAGPFKGKYTTGYGQCDSYAKNGHGAVDAPPNYGEESRAAYARDAAMKHPNDRPMFAADGTMLDDKGNRSIFDDVEE